MPQVRFTQDPKLPNDWKSKPYKKDWVGNLTQDEADRWVRRGVAEIISENKAVIRAAAVNPESAKSSDEKVELQQRALQVENEAKAKLEAKAEAEEDAAAAAKAKITATAPTVSGAQSQASTPRR